MKLFRKVIFWCHLFTGTVAGVIILIMSVTGVLLAYQRQITAWADTRSYRKAAPSTEAARLSIETLLAKTSATQRNAPSSITLRPEPNAPAAISFAGGRTVLVDPYTGDALSEGSTKVRAFFRAVTDWHRWLGASGENRAWGRAVTGACNLGFLFLVVSGIYLWMPRKWSWKAIKSVTWFKRGLSGKARDFNWHNVIGFWCLLPLFLVVLSGAVISYPWASDLVYRAVGETPPAPRAGPGGGPAPPNASSQPSMAFDKIDQLWIRAERQVSGWQSINLQVPASANAPLTFTIDGGDGGQPQKRAQLTLDRASGEVLRWEPFSSYTRGRQLRSFLRFAHTGEVAGMIGQTIAGTASLGGAVLVWTGLALAWRRWRAWLSRRSGSNRMQPS